MYYLCLQIIFGLLNRVKSWLQLKRVDKVQGADCEFSFYTVEIRDGYGRFGKRRESLLLNIFLVKLRRKGHKHDFSAK